MLPSNEVKVTTSRVIEETLQKTQPLSWIGEGPFSTISNLLGNKGVDQVSGIWYFRSLLFRKYYKILDKIGSVKSDLVLN